MKKENKLTKRPDKEAQNLNIETVDSCWKILIERLFPHFMEFFFPKMIPTHNIDYVEFLNKELEHISDEVKSQKNGKRYLDKLIKLPLKSDPDKFSLIHVEAQEHAGKNFKFRMLDYAALAYLNHKAPLTCLAIISKPSKTYNNEISINFHETELNLKYKDYLIIDQDEKLLMKSNNPYALVMYSIITIHSRDKQSIKKLKAKIRWMFKKMMKYNLSKTQMIPIYFILKNCAAKCLSDNNEFNNFTKELESLTKNNITMNYEKYNSIEDILIAKGVEQGIEQGIEKEKIEVIKEILSTDAINLTIKEIAKLLKVNESEVKRIKNELDAEQPITELV